MRTTKRLGAEERSLQLLWQAPDRIDRVLLRVVLLSGHRVIASSKPQLAVRKAASISTPGLPGMPGEIPISPGGAEVPNGLAPAPGGPSTTVLPNAESVISAGGVTLVVPAGTVEQPSAAWVQPLPIGDPDLGGLGADIHIDADWADGTKEVQITMPLPSDLQDSLEPMIVHDLPGGERQLLMGDALDIDAAQGTVTFSVTGLSRFWSVGMPSALRLVSGGPAIYNYDLAQKLFEDFVGLSAEQPVCDPDLTASALVNSAGSAFTRSSLGPSGPAIRHCVSLSPAGNGQLDRGRWVLANNTGAVLKVSVDDGARIVNFGVAKDLLTDVAFLALNGASAGVIDAGTQSASDSTYGPEAFVPPGGSVVVTVAAGEQARIDFTASPQLLPHAFVLRQLGTLLGDRSEAVELLGRLNACGYSLAISPLQGLVSCIKEVATEIGGKKGKLLKKALFGIDAFASSLSTFVHFVDPLQADLRFAASAPPRGEARTERIDVASDGGAPDAVSDPWSIDASEDGCRIAFVSSATNIVAGPEPPGSLLDDVYVRDICAHTTTKVTAPLRPQMGCFGSINTVRISGNGRYVLFASCAENLVPVGEPGSELFVHDLLSGQTQAVPGVTSDNLFGSVDISEDGRWITYQGFDSLNDKAAQAVLYDRVTRTSAIVSRSPEGALAADHAVPQSISANGRYVAYVSTWETFDPPSSSPIAMDTVYLYDRVLETTRRLPRLEQCRYPAGETVYDSEYHLVDNVRLTGSGEGVLLSCQSAIGLFDTSTDSWRVIETASEDREWTAERCTLAPASSWVPADITPDGRFVAFARACVAPEVLFSWGDEGEVIVRDLASGEDTVISAQPGCEGTNPAGYLPGTLSADARVVVYVGLCEDYPLMADVR